MALILSLAAATALGILTGLGIGGGSLLLLYLTLVLSMELSAARGISLLFFFPASLLSCFLHRKEIPWKDLLPAIISGCLSAILFSLLSSQMKENLLRIPLGLLFLFIGFRELRTSGDDKRTDKQKHRVP